MNKLFARFGLLSGTLFCFILFISYSNNENADTKKQEDALPQVIKAVPFQPQTIFAGESLPPDNEDALERLDREILVNSYWHSNTALSLKLANRYFPTIERILKEQGVPEDFKYLAVAESGLRNVTSPAQAKGFWQFRKLAAEEFDLEVNSEVDERYHLEKSTKAAAKYIKQLKERFGSWTDAAAAYNIGPTNYQRILNDQGQNNYFDLNLNPETSRYVFRLMAIKTLFESPEHFGFYLDKNELYKPFKYTFLTIKETVPSWADFSNENGISYRELKRMNPWLIDSKLTVKKNIYEVKIPAN
jgi:hypothetical protein